MSTLRKRGVFGDNMGRLVRESNLLDFTLTSRMEMSERHGDHYMYSYKSSNGQNVSIRLPRADLFDRTTGKWIVEEVQPQEEPQNPGMRGTNIITSLEMEVVGTITIWDTSLIASLGEYFSPFPFIVLYHFYLVMF